MHSDMLKKHNLIDMNRQEIKKLLGEPDSENATSMSWDMGQIGGFDDNSFDVQMQNDKAIGYKIFQR